MWSTMPKFDFKINCCSYHKVHWLPLHLNKKSRWYHSCNKLNTEWIRSFSTSLKRHAHNVCVSVVRLANLLSELWAKKTVKWKRNVKYIRKCSNINFFFVAVIFMDSLSLFNVDLYQQTHNFTHFLPLFDRMDIACFLILKIALPCRLKVKN